MWFFFIKKKQKIKLKDLTKTQRLILLFVLSTIIIILGALAKIKHWETVKILMPIGMLLQMIVVIAGIVHLWKKDKKAN